MLSHNYDLTNHDFFSYVEGIVLPYRRDLNDGLRIDKLEIKHQKSQYELIHFILYLHTLTVCQ